jgi:methionyl-tRNA synthetase
MRHLVFIPPPCTNGRIHVGHLGGCFVPADVTVRFLRLEGHEALLFGGADELNAYTLKTAETEGASLLETSSKYASTFLDAFEVFGIQCDQFVRTSSTVHREMIHQIFNDLVEAGQVRFGAGHLLKCRSCEQILVDRLATGYCGCCGNESSLGPCEVCDEYVRPMGLREPRHVDCGRPAEIIDFPQAFLHQAYVADKLESFAPDLRWPPGVLETSIRWLRDNEDLPLLQVFSHSEPLAHPSFVAETPSLPIWHEAVWGGLTASKLQAGDAWKAYVDSADGVWAFSGQDSRHLYTTLLPAVMLGIGMTRPVSHIGIQNFMTLEGEKISTSRNHAIWYDELPEDVSPELMRLELTLRMRALHEGQGDLTSRGLMSTRSLLRKLERWFASGLREGSNVLPQMVHDVHAYRKAFYEVRPYDAAGALCHAIERETGASEGPTPRLAQLILAMLWPFMPKLAEQLGEEALGRDWTPGSPAGLIEC